MTKGFLNGSTCRRYMIGDVNGACHDGGCSLTVSQQCETWARCQLNESYTRSTYGRCEDIDGWIRRCGQFKPTPWMRRVRCVSVASVLRQVAFTQAFAASSRCFGTDDDGVLKVPVCGVP